MSYKHPSQTPKVLHPALKRKRHERHHFLLRETCSQVLYAIPTHIRSHIKDIPIFHHPPDRSTQPTREVLPLRHHMNEIQISIDAATSSKTLIRSYKLL